MTTSDPCLTLEVALVLISEKARFWSDEQRGLRSELLAPRCMDAARLAELRQSLIEIAGHCATALAKAKEERAMIQRIMEVR